MINFEQSGAETPFERYSPVCDTHVLLAEIVSSLLIGDIAL